MTASPSLPCLQTYVGIVNTGRHIDANDFKPARNASPGRLRDDAILTGRRVKRLRIRAAEHGRSAEAERREILRVALGSSERPAAREQAAARLAEFRHRTEGRRSPSSADLLGESRRNRAEGLAGKGT